MIFISQIIVAGLSKAGANKSVNEDTFQCMKRIYPDTLDRFELQYGKCDAHWQVYSVTDGMGGSGVGDISGRLVQNILIQHVSDLGNTDPLTFDFAEFSTDFLNEVNIHLEERLAKYRNIDVGCSLAFILINGATAYTFSIGSNRIYLIRNHKAYQVTKEHCQKNSSKPVLYLGNLKDPQKYEPQNMNKLSLQQDDILFIVSDGIYQKYSDQQIINLFEQHENFVEFINAFEKKLAADTAEDDQTILALKIKNTQGIVLEKNNLEQNLTDEASRSNNLYGETEQDDLTDPYHDPYYHSQTKEKSKFVKGLSLFFKSFGIGLLIGILLLLLFWIFYVGF